MNRYRLELSIAVVMVAVFAVLSHWQAPSRTLTKADVDGYIERIEPALPLPPSEKGDMLAHLRSWGDDDDGRPVFMLNLMRYYDAPRILAGHPELTGSPRDLNAHYESVVMPLLLRLGAYPLFAGDPAGVGRAEAAGTNLMGYDEALENWSRVLVIRYPDRRSFFDLLSNPEYQKVLPYKLASLKIVLLPMHDEMVVPDLRWPLATALLAVFVLVTLLRSARRSRTSVEGS